MTARELQRTEAPGRRWKRKVSFQRMHVTISREDEDLVAVDAEGGLLDALIELVDPQRFEVSLRVMDTGSFNPRLPLQMGYPGFRTRQVDYFSRRSVNCMQTGESKPRGSVNDSRCSPFHQR